MIIGVTGASVGEVCRIRDHPDGTFIWLADVVLRDDDQPRQIVFGGNRKLTGGELVPVAPPGTWTLVRGPGLRIRRKKMRTRTFRGQRSHGMLCSLDELGWLHRGPDEVAILRNLAVGQTLDDLPVEQRPEVVVEWERAVLMAKRARTALTEMFDPAAEAM